MPVQLITQTAYARHRGCDEKAVRKAIAAGRISVIDGMIDPTVADIQWARNTRARAGSARPPAPAVASESPPPAPPASGPGIGGGADYSVDRSRREKYEADMAELKLLEQRGELVRVAEVRAEISRQLGQVRTNLLQIAARLAPVIAGETDQLKVHALLDGEIRSVLSAIARSD